MGIHANVYRNNAYGDCTNNGTSSEHDHVCVVNADGPFSPDDEHPAFVLVKHRTMNHVYAVPKELYESGAWTMMGGNFLYSSDSRFSIKVRQLLGDGYAFVGAVPIHDRVE